jgi:hypothetical protein
MAKAKSYEQYAAAGFMLDRCTSMFSSPLIAWSKRANRHLAVDKDEWKNEEQSGDYDYELIKERLSVLRTIRKNGDIPAMIFNLRTSLARNLGDMGNPKVRFLHPFTY